MSEMEEEGDGELFHYGILRKSGRYPWGSGKDEYTRSMTFQDMVANLKGQGVAYKDMAKAMGLDPAVEKDFSLTALRDTITIAKETVITEETHRLVTLRDKQYSIQAMVKATGIPQATIRLRLKNADNLQKESIKATASVIREAVDKHGILDVGKGNNFDLGISPERYRTAISVLRDEGYERHLLKIQIPGSKNFTNQVVLVPKGTGFSGASKLRNQIETTAKWSLDDGRTFLGIHPPISLSSKRIKIEHSSEKDGVIYVRPDVNDLSMGKNKYAQVRIAVDGTHYMKGVAIVTKDIPAGVDVVYHSAKKVGTPLKSDDPNASAVLKKMKTDETGAVDKDNPFGSSIKRQIIEVGKDGKEKNTSVMNLLREEGDWETWTNSLPAQMLSKQPQPFIRSQLAETTKKYKLQVDEINSINNPVLRRKLLEKLSDKIESDAVDLRAAALPHQKTAVIIPVPKMNPNEVYAPRFETGERVVLIRYPHGGRFEIPEVTVNNNNPAAKKLLGDAPDAIGIHPKIAEKLSGADFDGDTVTIIPNAVGKVRSAATLGRAGYEFEKGLNGFDPKQKYGGFVQDKNADGSPKVDKKGDPIGNFKLMKNTGQEMGMITNLITDMSIQGARPDHMVRAVKHSMVVIDAEKHQLNYRQSAIDNGITQLNKVYRSEGTGAGTLISRATAKQFVDERKLRLAQQGGPIDERGAKVFVPTNRTVSKFDKKTGTYLPETVKRQQQEKRLALTDDAHSLVSDRKHPVEVIYADHANAMKALANSTRLGASKIGTPKINKEAKRVYKAEVDDLVRQLHEAQKQKPLERQANRIANAVITQKRQEDPTLRFDKDRLTKVEKQARDGAWARMGLERSKITITDSAWDAIQAGAVSATTFREILSGNYVKQERLFELALPKVHPVVSNPALSRAKAMLDAGLTNADIARQLGVSPSTLRAALIKAGA